MKTAYLKYLFLMLVAGFAYQCSVEETTDDSATSPSSGGGTGDDDDTDTDSDSDDCSYLANTTETSNENTYGCYTLDRDTSSCEDDRTAQGLSGFWLNFSCRVTLTVSGSDVTIAFDSQPDYKSYYWEDDSSCYEDADLSDRSEGFFKIEAQTISMTVPMSASTNDQDSSVIGGVIGVAASGVSIYGNTAAPGDNIYEEVATFDLCDAHTDGTGRYHHHTEPTPMSYLDDRFIGVFMDGYPIYGRYEYDTETAPSDLDDYGGHTGLTPDSTSTPVYHYHVNYQTDGTDNAYFISAGTMNGTLGTCSGCE